MVAKKTILAALEKFDDKGPDMPIMSQKWNWVKMRGFRVLFHLSWTNWGRIPKNRIYGAYACMRNIASLGVSL